MLIKSKSLIAAVGLALVALLTFAVGARILGTKEKTSFAEDGYILSASAQDRQENVTVSDQLWFSAGTVWTSSGETIAFTGSEGSAIETAADSFIHYEGSSIASVTDTSVMNLDEFTDGVIQYYGMEQGETLSRTADGSYYLGDDTQETFENFLIKSSDIRYIFGSSMITLMRSAGSGDSIDSGFAEVEYLSDDKSIVLINDGVNAWQFLSEGAWLQLANGVCFDLASGELYVPADVTEIETGELSSSSALTEALLNISVDDIEIDAGASNASSWTSSGYPVYRFTVINGLDGADGEDGASGEDGADGEDGEQGEDGQTGESDVSGEEGATGTTGTAGTEGLNGASGGLVSGVAMATSVPTITVSSWVVDGQVLSFELTMDEVSCDSIEEGTTVITLTDLDTGEVIRVWTSDSSYDSDYYYELADVLDSTNDNDALAYNGLEAGHQYQVTVYAEYILEGLDEPVGQVLLTRTFTADDYGISFDLIDRTEDSFTFTLNTENRLVTMEEVVVYVDGVYYDTFSDFDEIEIDLAQLSTSSEYDYSNQSFTITFQPTFVVMTYTLDENNEVVMTTTTMSDITYE
ncbi:MAG: hypothetical protein LUE31_09580 [Lachnospiraceae bacterium]|nr:hypothetical protein [Lachnospiraceae bacterium]